jgi:hypothetical protein
MLLIFIELFLVLQLNKNNFLKLISMFSNVEAACFVTFMMKWSPLKWFEIANVFPNKGIASRKPTFALLICDVYGEACLSY